MLKKNNLVTWLALSIAMLHLVSILFSIQLLSDITKTLIMPGIAGFIANEWKKNNTHWPLPLVAAILFSWFGDMALMIRVDQETWFMAGVGFFLIAQVFYTILYFKSTRQLQASQNSFLHWTGYIVIAFYAIFLWMKLYPGLGPMQWPVAIYTLALTAMVLAACYRFRRTGVVSFWLVFIGAILFMVSDSMIAINRFLSPLPNERLWIMTTYILAQWLIANGIITHYKKTLAV